MRKNLFALLVIWTLPHIAWGYASTGQCNGMNDEACSVQSGCYWKCQTDDDCACEPCPVGTFKDSEGSTCKLCDENNDETGFFGKNQDTYYHPYNGKPSESTVSWTFEYDDKYIGAESSSECAWTAKCPAGYYFDDATLSNSKELSCAACGAYQIVDSKQFSGSFELNGYKPQGIACTDCPENSKQNADKNKCECEDGYHVEKDDDIYDYRNRIVVCFDKAECYADKKLTCIKNEYKVLYKDIDEYGDGYDLCLVQDPSVGLLDDKGYKNAISSTCSINLPGNQHVAYYIDCNDTTKQYKFGEVFSNLTGHVCVIPHWEDDAPFTVTYDKCKDIKTECKMGEDCKVGCNVSVEPPKYFVGWTCDGCNANDLSEQYATDNTNILIPNANLKGAAKSGETINLTAKIVECAPLYDGSNVYGSVQENYTQCTMSAGDYEDDLHNKFTVPDNCTYSPPSP